MKIFTVTIAVYIILCTFAFADVLYFKNGGEIEGIITEESDDYIVIDIAGGTVSVRKDEIDRIEEASPEDRERLEKERLSHEIEIGGWAPFGYEEVRMAYLKANNSRAALKKARKKSKITTGEICEKEIKISELLELVAGKDEELKTIDSEKETKRYNEIVTKINSINADLNKENNELKSLREKEKESNENLIKRINGYRDDFKSFKDVMDRRFKDINEDEILPDELYFFEEMNSAALEMEGDFKKDIVEYTPEDSHVIVDALIDDNVLARLIVDTGASIVLITRDVAYRLGVKYDDIQARIEIIMADGSSTEARPIILKSIKVGDVEVKNVRAAILENDVIGGADGLLGMSFLSHFVIKVDSAASKLILEKLL